MSDASVTMVEPLSAARSDYPLRLSAVCAGILVGTAVLMVFLILPLYVGALAGIGFDDGQLGVLAAMDLSGMAAASILALFWIKRLNWRRVGLLALAALGAINLLCLGITDYHPLLLMRLTAGLAAGTTIVLSYSIIANTSHPDRYMGFFVSTQVLSGSIGFIALPMLMPQLSADLFYYLFGGLALAAMPLVIWFPSTGHAEQGNLTETKQHNRPAKRAVFLILIAMALFFIGQGSIWAYAERIGSAAGLAPQTIGQVLAATSFAALFGGLLSAWLDVRFGRFWPVALAIAIQLAALTQLQGDLSPITFASIFAIFNFSWNFGIAYQVGALVNSDRNGRYVALIPAFQGMGLALGPALAGTLAAAEGLVAVNLVSGVALAAYLALILPHCRRSN